jgi:D-alanyl-lipoteichoic acid acyltransferase DltB (MBOAT superfamily)
VHAPAALRPRLDPGIASLRILFGATKAFFLGALLWKFTYRQLLLDGRTHGLADFAVAAVAYYLFLYCNFSGFCDIAVGVGGWVGVPVAENFDRPLSARNVREFWNRWHITLSTYMRDLVFVPVSKALVRRCGPSRANDAIAAATIVVFLLIGIWHGFGWNYAAFGASQALGVVANLYYGAWLKSRLGKVRFKAYMENRGVHAFAVAVTFAYMAASLALFANDPAALWNLGQLLTH